MSREKVDPDLRRFLETLSVSDETPLAELSPATARQLDTAFLDNLWKNVPPEPVASVEDRLLRLEGRSLAVRIYRSAASLGAPAPVILYFHGGGWVLGSLSYGDRGCRRLANAAECAVISVDYRLAPEHPFPAGLMDCYDAAHWIWNNAASLGWDASRIAVCGESAGGNLAAGTTLLARARNELRIACQILIYPVLDLVNLNTASYAEFSEGYGLTKQAMEWFIDHYMPDPAGRSDPLVSPLRAPDLRHLPPACIVTPECDVLRDEAEAYARRLEAARVHTIYRSFPGMIHDFYLLWFLSPQAAAARDDVHRQIRALLHPTSRL